MTLQLSNSSQEQFTATAAVVLPGDKPILEACSQLRVSYSTSTGATLPHGVTQLGYEADDSPPSIAEVKN